MKTEKIIVNELQLTTAEIEKLQLTWEKIGNSVEMAIDFYNRLFYLFPVLRPLFKEDIRLQARKFTAHVSYLMKNIHNWNNIEKDVEELGKRHLTYEVKDHHYVYVKAALIFALKKHLANEWDSQLELGWNKFYDMVAESMMNTFHTHRSS